MNNLNVHVCGMYVSHGCKVFACMPGANIGNVFLNMTKYSLTSYSVYVHVPNKTDDNMHNT